MASGVRMVLQEQLVYRVLLAILVIKDQLGQTVHRELRAILVHQDRRERLDLRVRLASLECLDLLGLSARWDVLVSGERLVSVEYKDLVETLGRLDLLDHLDRQVLEDQEATLDLQVPRDLRATVDNQAHQENKVELESQDLLVRSDRLGHLVARVHRVCRELQVLQAVQDHMEISVFLAVQERSEQSDYQDP